MEPVGAGNAPSPLKYPVGPESVRTRAGAGTRSRPPPVRSARPRRGRRPGRQSSVKVTSTKKPLPVAVVGMLPVGCP